MADRIDALERLSRLHAEGKLSDAEFAAAKQRALTESGGRMPLWWVFAIGVAALVLFGLLGWALSPVPQLGNTAETPMPRASETATENFSDYAMPSAIPTPIPLPTPTVTPSPTPSPTPADLGWTGTYEGRFDGGDGSVTIVPRAGGRLAARVEVAAPGCVGEFAGVTRDTPDNRLLLTGRFDESDEDECRITLDRSGNRIDVDETDCLAFHGAACGFSGSLTRR